MVSTQSEIKYPLSHMKDYGHEQIVFCNDSRTGLQAIIAIHSTVLGPALGGTRMWPYQNEEEALIDVLRLSRGMSYKAAVSGLNLGGGKAVIIGESRTQKTEMMFRKFGQFVDSLGGRYITAEDVGMTVQDMEYIAMETKYVSGTPIYAGGSGDPSPFTALGVWSAMRACLHEVYGKDSVSGKKVLVQGVGNVGTHLIGHLIQNGAEVYVSDIFEDKINAITSKYNVNVIPTTEVYSTPVDVYAPCALGATLNTKNIQSLHCDIVCGAANNQLENEEIHGKMLKDKNILYAPDFLVNAGGIINISEERFGYNHQRAEADCIKIFDRMNKIIDLSKTSDITTHRAAIDVAEQRINDAAWLNRSFSKQ